MFKASMAAAAKAPQTVSTITAAPSEWQSFVESTGTLRAVRGADLSAQASGVVDVLAIDSGSEVPAGKVLLRLNPNDDYAKLQQLQAAAELAEQTLKRDQEQFAAQAISQANIDTDVSTLKSARAQVSAQQALIAEKIVKAPFAGRLGIRQVDIGQYLAAGTTVVTLQALDPILVDFYVPQQALAQLKIGQPVSATVDTFAKQAFGGAIEAINSKVDTSSRNVQVRAALPNPDRRLVPGMFADVRIQFGEKNEQITLPQTVVTYNPFGDTVFVVQKDGVDSQGNPRLTVQQRFVKLGATRGDQIAVLSGVKAGEIVVSGGQMKLRNGTAVAINNEVLPSNNPNPNPPNE
jgi:membrane fusion protein (multidrug efflux system)